MLLVFVEDALTNKIIILFLCSGKIAAGAVVCVESEIKGDVTIGVDLLSTFSHTFVKRHQFCDSNCVVYLCRC